MTAPDAMLTSNRFIFSHSKCNGNENRFRMRRRKQKNFRDRKRALTNQIGRLCRYVNPKPPQSQASICCKLINCDISATYFVFRLYRIRRCSQMLRHRHTPDPEPAPAPPCRRRAAPSIRRFSRAPSRRRCSAPLRWSVTRSPSSKQAKIQ